ncbi:kinesin-like protein KIN-14C [Tanacetum coccineum]
MILTANKKLERLKKQDWGKVQRLIYDLERSKQGEEQDRESLRLESEEKRKRDLEREAARALQKTTYEEKVRDLQNKLDEAEKLRKELHNKIVELKGNIRVFVRVRPMLPYDGDIESALSYPMSLQLAGRGIEVIESGQKTCFAFDKVFDHHASQEDVFTEISELVQCTLDGHKVFIFAYGQTGSGKSYTMIGRPNHPLQKGLIPCSLEHIFQTSQALVAQGWKYKMQNENIQDLLASKERRKQQPEYKISHDAEGNTYISDLTIVDEIVLPRKSQKKPPTALAGLFLNKGTKHHVSANEVKTKLIHSKDANIMKQAYALFALGTIICAPRGYLAPYYLRYVRDVSALKKKQCAAHAIYCLVEGIDKYKKTKGSTRHSLRYAYQNKHLRSKLIGKRGPKMECNNSSKTIMGLSSLDEILDATTGDAGKETCHKVGLLDHRNEISLKNILVKAQTPNEVLEVISDTILAVKKGLSPSPLSPLNLETTIYHIARLMDETSITSISNMAWALPKIGDESRYRPKMVKVDAQLKSKIGNFGVG